MKEFLYYFCATEIFQNKKLQNKKKKKPISLGVGGKRLESGLDAGKPNGLRWELQRVLARRESQLQWL